MIIWGINCLAFYETLLYSYFVGITSVTVNFFFQPKNFSVTRRIYGLRETHYSGIVKMVDVVVCVVIVENVSLLSQPSA